MQQKDLKERGVPQEEMDILEMPVEALAAYWLSIKKLLDAKRDKALLAAELENTGERYIRHLLDAALSGLDRDTLRGLARAKAATLLAEARRRFDMMRLGLMGVALGENPRLTFIRLSALMTPPALGEKRAFELAHGLMATVGEKDADLRVLLSADHKQKDDRLVVKLLFYALAARRNGRQSLHEHLPHLRPGPFADGLSLAADGFEAEFVSRHMLALRDQAMAGAGRKMRMAAEMCLAIKAGLSYDDVFRVARSFMA
ncbi:hypothetical protein SAMN04488503_2709 [Humidesulfovibrio mexicanus]|uniref:Uncharacterized protein n=1 Tax=Humidesulfovibrio mexicanus TaxID=147047 RepID=A0A239BRG5_9BACT|nr:hypothetical protein [Humidesulfovibrio mexicanus]SNS09624.1 hypothetical protein SAMN04488503_2709 [Humidesulfovibrio mexicanus]